MTDEIVLPVDGLPYLMRWMMQSPITGVPDLQLLLFTNIIDPDCNVILSDLTEATFGGYSRWTLSRSQWLDPTIEGCCGIMLYGTDPVSWTNTSSPQTITGYAYLLPGGNKLIAVQALSTPVTVPTLGTLAMRPQITLTTGACS